MTAEKLRQTAAEMLSEARGILAMDESGGTIGKRFQQIGVESTEQTRRFYRDLLATTPGIGDHISGAILFDETIRGSTLNGTRFADKLAAAGVVPGIKVDKGAKDLAGNPGEKVTEGLDGLRERLAEYVTMGARFTKWRAVITIGDGIPSRACIEANAHALARYAGLAQEAGLVPIVEPEVLIDGDHTIERCEEVTDETLNVVFEELFRQGVLLEGMVLKPSMVISGKSCPRRAGVDEVAERTLRTLLRCVPAAVPGIAFLSGGQGNEEATQHLNAINRLRESLPWRVTFSYARALQQVAMEAWRGDDSQREAAQKAFLHRAWLNSEASEGRYREDMEQQAA